MGVGPGLGAACGLGWTALAFGAGYPMVVGICGPLRAWPGARLWDLVLAVNPPGALIAGNGVMIAAMMAPLLSSPLRHVHERSFSNRRLRAMTLFGVGYGAAWLIALVALDVIVLGLVAAATRPVSIVLVAAAALTWQASPAKQTFLNGCHRRPALAAFGLAADRDALQFGLTHGAWCVGSCWALMALPVVCSPGHLVAMALVSLLLSAERLDDPSRPSWRLRGPSRIMRMVQAWLGPTLAGIPAQRLK